MSTPQPDTFDLREYATRLADFVIAETARNLSPHELSEVAGRVLVFREGKFERVADIVCRAQKHGWNSSIYEAYCWEFKNQIMAYQKNCHPLVFSALYAHANVDNELDISHEHVFAAIDEARRAVEGSHCD